jgi:hypothetical protein
VIFCGVFSSFTYISYVNCNYAIQGYVLIDRGEVMAEKPVARVGDTLQNYPGAGHA